MQEDVKNYEMKNEEPTMKSSRKSKMNIMQLYVLTQKSTIVYAYRKVKCGSSIKM